MVLTAQIEVDGQVVDLVDPALCTPVPGARDALARPDDAVAALTVLDPAAQTLRPLECLQAGELSDAGLIDAIAACDRQRAAVDALQVQFLARLQARDPEGGEYLQDEVGCAMHLAPGTAHERIETATALIGRLWDTFELLRAGRLSAVHARILAGACAGLSDEVTAAVQARVLGRACSQTPGEFRASVRRAVAHVDRKSEKKRHAEAVEQRRVVHQPAEDGMSWINLFLPNDGAAIFMTAVNARAVRTGADDERTADQRRADAAVEIALAALGTPGLVANHGVRPTVNLTMAASTAAGEDDQPACLDGIGPVPAEVGRRLAADVSARRYYWLVDPTGRLLDVTRCPTCQRATQHTKASTQPGADDTLAADSYQPPVRIARHVITRDQHCVMPGCRRKAWTCELDHRMPWPQGPTSAENLQPLCKRHHDLKHRSTWTVQRHPDGSYEWTSPTNHTYRYRPPPLPVPEPMPPSRIDDEPPPF